VKTIEQELGTVDILVPIGRYGTPQEYADVIAFLASPRASYLTGSAIRIDGALIPSI